MGQGWRVKQFSRWFALFGLITGLGKGLIALVRGKYGLGDRARLGLKMGLVKVGMFGMGWGGGGLGDWGELSWLLCWLAERGGRICNGVAIINIGKNEEIFVQTTKTF